VFVFYFVNFLPWKQNKDLLEVLKLNSQGSLGAIEVYTKPISKFGVGFSESLEHVSQTAMALASNPNVPTEFKQKLFDELDKAFAKHLERVPNDARYRLFYGMFLSRFGWYGRSVEQLVEASKLSPRKQQILFELTSNYLLDNKVNEAVKSAKEAYEAEPKFEEARFVYGLTLLALGDVASSNQVFAGIPKEKIILDDRYTSVLLMMRQFNQLIEVARMRIELEPNNLQHRMTLAAAYLEAGRRTDAIREIETIIRIEPSFKEQGEYYIGEIKKGLNP
jgi:tetratricopeptide (TPR) repeat protein